jgi:hypothetical protein
MFAWCPADMPGIPRELAEHEVKIFPNAKPIKQSTRCYNSEKARTMGEEINPLLEAKFIREIKEATWLSPPVMVEKKETKDLRDVHRIHRAKEALPEGLLLAPSNRSDHRLHRWLRTSLVPRHLLWVQSDKAEN